MRADARVPGVLELAVMWTDARAPQPLHLYRVCCFVLLVPTPLMYRVPREVKVKEVLSGRGLTEKTQTPFIPYRIPTGVPMRVGFGICKDCGDAGRLKYGARRSRVIRLIAGTAPKWSVPKDFANVKFSICTRKERLFSAKGCVLSKQVVNLTLVKDLGPTILGPFQRSQA